MSVATDSVELPRAELLELQRAADVVLVEALSLRAQGPVLEARWQAALKRLEAASSATFHRTCRPVRR